MTERDMKRVRELGVGSALKNECLDKMLDEVSRYLDLNTVYKVYDQEELDLLQEIADKTDELHNKLEERTQMALDILDEFEMPCAVFTEKDNKGKNHCVVIKRRNK